MGYKQNINSEEFQEIQRKPRSKNQESSLSALKTGKVTGTYNNLNLTPKNQNFSGAVRFVFSERNQNPKRSPAELIAKKDLTGRDLGEGNMALPFFPYIRNIPYIGDDIIILEFKPKQGSYVTQYYYISSLNTNNNILTPNVDKTDLDKDGNVRLGRGLNEDSLKKIRKLFLASGDCVLEGKFGNTIRLGNSNNNTPWVPKNLLSNDPITIIRNGQKETNSLNPIFEDINEDNSSIYLTKGQIISIDVISKNLQTFDVEEEEKQTTTKDDLPSMELNKNDYKNNSDSSPTILNPKQPSSNLPEETTNQQSNSEEVPKNQTSDQAFVKEGSSEQISSESTSDPTFI